MEKLEQLDKMLQDVIAEFKDIKLKKNMADSHISVAKAGLEKLQSEIRELEKAKSEVSERVALDKKTQLEVIDKKEELLKTKEANLNISLAKADQLQTTLDREISEYQKKQNEADRQRQKYQDLYDEYEGRMKKLDGLRAAL